MTENGRSCGRCGDLHPWDAVKCECGCLLVMSARDRVLAKSAARPVNAFLRVVDVLLGGDHRSGGHPAPAAKPGEIMPPRRSRP